MDDSRYIEGIVPVEIERDALVMQGDLAVPAEARGLIVLAHGPGESRASPRIRFEAALLRQHGLGTLVMDLLTAAEGRADAADGRWSSDERGLAGRMADAAIWLARQPGNPGLPVGLFAAGPAAAAALCLAATRPDLAGVVVCRSPGVLPPAPTLERLRVPVLIVCGELDETGLERAHHALMHMAETQSHLEIVPGASHLFEERGKLDQACALAGAWFRRWLPRRSTAHPTSGG